MSTIPRKPRVLTPAEISESEDEFIAEVRRELLIRGEDLSSPHIIRQLSAMRDRMQVKPLYLHNEVTWWGSTATGSAGGLIKSPRKAADAIAEMAAERAHLATFGPDPAELLVTRLVALGISTDEAQRRAAGRIRRLEDGRVEARKHDGGVLYTSPAQASDREYTAEELASLRDPKQALTVLTRAILDEIESPPPARNLAPRDYHAEIAQTF